MSEDLLFDGVVPPRHGLLHPDLPRPGIGWRLEPDAARVERDPFQTGVER